MRIVLTGGPGGGKTTAADLFRREVGDRVVIVPEAATLLFAGGLPRVDEVGARQAEQRAIFHVQRSLEDIQASLFPDRTLLCDRGTIDGSVYWPDGRDGFFAEIGSTLEIEMARYDAVLFFESAAVGGVHIEGGNPTRIEDTQQAAELDKKLRDVWSLHPNFTLVEHRSSFFDKLSSGLAALRSVIG